MFSSSYPQLTREKNFSHIIGQCFSISLLYRIGNQLILNTIHTQYNINKFKKKNRIRPKQTIMSKQDNTLRSGFSWAGYGRPITARMQPLKQKQSNKSKRTLTHSSKQLYYTIQKFLYKNIDSSEPNYKFPNSIYNFHSRKYKLSQVINHYFFFYVILY